MYVRKALAAVLSILNAHVILLSKVTPRYVTLFTKGFFIIMYILFRGTVKSTMFWDVIPRNMVELVNF
jgi:hypothetical protein